MDAREYYSNFVAGNGMRESNYKLLQVILSYFPTSVFEFGCGIGKHLDPLQRVLGPRKAFGIDISRKAVAIAQREGLWVHVGDEHSLPKVRGFDIAFTCSVLDHIEGDIGPITTQFKRIAKKAVLLFETADIVGQYYFAHDYETCGFEKSGYSWRSPTTCALYQLWRLELV